MSVAQRNFSCVLCQIFCIFVLLLRILIVSVIYIYINLDKIQYINLSSLQLHKFKLDKIQPARDSTAVE